MCLEVIALQKNVRSPLHLWKTIPFVKPISFFLPAGEALAIVGSENSGKLILAEMIAGLVRPSGGEILFNGNRLHFGNFRRWCKIIRVILGAADSLHPRIRVGTLLETPLKCNTTLSAAQREQAIMKILHQVGLLPSYATFYPYMLSTGQKQRIAVARALILQPKIILFLAGKEWVMMDVSVRSQLINLLLELQAKQAMAAIYLFEQLELVKHMSDKILFMQKGELIATYDTREVLRNVHHPLTQTLLNPMQSS